jgi:hypothetical protein
VRVLLARADAARAPADELLQLAPDAPGPVEALKALTLRLFASDKLLLRRSGLEAVGELAKSLLWNFGYSRQVRCRSPALSLTRFPPARSA